MFDIEIRNLNPVEGGFFDTKTEQTPVGKRGSAQFNPSHRSYFGSRAGTWPSQQGTHPGLSGARRFVAHSRSQATLAADRRILA